MKKCEYYCDRKGADQTLARFQDISEFVSQLTGLESTEDDTEDDKEIGCFYNPNVSAASLNPSQEPSSPSATPKEHQNKPFPEDGPSIEELNDVEKRLTDAFNAMPLCLRIDNLVTYETDMYVIELSRDFHKFPFI